MLLPSPQVHLDGQIVMTEGHRQRVDPSLPGSVGVLAGMVFRQMTQLFLWFGQIFFET